jgi:hypothetical protein
VSRHVRRFGDGRRTEEGVDRLLPLGEEEGARLLFPDQILATESGGPGVVDVGGKAGDDLERTDRVDLEQDDDGWLIEGTKMCSRTVNCSWLYFDGHPLWALDHRPRDAPPGDRFGVLGHPKRELEVMEPLDRPRPELKAPVFGAHRDGAPPDRREVRPRTRGPRQRQRGLAEAEGGDGERPVLKDLGRHGRRRAGRAGWRCLGGGGEGGMADQGRDEGDDAGTTADGLHRERVHAARGAPQGHGVRPTGAVAPAVVSSSNPQHAG